VVPFEAMPLLIAVVLAIFPGLEGLGGARSSERANPALARRSR
jgi:hypothetical protein